jgi:hypothetical protein
MLGASRNHVSDLRGLSRLAIDATIGLAGLVEAMHVTIARRPARLGGPVVEGAVHGIARLVYASVRDVTLVAGSGIDIALGQLAPALGDMEPSPRATPWSPPSTACSATIWRRPATRSRS